MLNIPTLQGVTDPATHDALEWLQTTVWPKENLATEMITATELAAALVPETWHVVGAGGEPAFAGTWVAFGGGFIAPSFKKMPDGTVRLEGLVINPNAEGGGGLIFTLPVGYRPTGNCIYSSVSLGVAIDLRVGSNGQVIHNPATAANAWVSLAGITFLTI